MSNNEDWKPEESMVQAMIKEVKAKAANYLRWLQTEGFIEKLPNGQYRHTPEGIVLLRRQVEQLRKG